MKTTKLFGIITIAFLVMLCLVVRGYGAPVVSVQPQPWVGFQGNSVTLSVAVVGSGSLSYQWIKNEVLIPGASNATLTISAVQFPDNGHYSVRITDSMGSTDSLPARLSVLPLTGGVIGVGNNDYGQLGDGLRMPVAVDMSGILAGKTVTAVAAGNGHSLALTSDGKVYAWGWNGSGQLGDGTNTSRTTPVAVDMSGALAGKTVTAIAVGYSHSFALTSDGKVYGWGYNPTGELGNGTTTARNTPGAVDMSGVLVGKTVTAIAAGHSHTVVVTSDGKIFAWGFNNASQIGDGTTTDRLTPVAVDMSGVLAGKTVTAVTVGLYHGIVRTSDGKLYGWGYNAGGELGDGTNTGRSTPVAVNMNGVLAGKTVAAIRAGYGHSLALTSDGKVYVWGQNLYGQLGDGTTTSRNTPVAVNMTGVLAGKVVTVIAVGNYHNVALTQDGKLYAWGANDKRQLGDGTTTDRTVPVAVDMSGALAGNTITAVAAGARADHSLVLTSDGKVYACGYNDYGQLGNGTTQINPTPVAVDMSGVLAGKTVTAIAAGSRIALVLSHTVSLTSEGKVYAWGSNEFGKLGDGTTTDRPSPVAVDMSGALAGKTVTAIATGQNHTVALTLDGKVYAWGQSGKLGSSVGGNSASPLAVNTSGVLAGKTVTAIAAGQNHTVALTSDGKVYAWGNNFNGQLGDGTTTQRTLPAAVDMSGVLAGKMLAAIAAGQNHTVALTSDGKVYAWGNNDYGKLGDGTGMSKTTPVATDMSGVLAGKSVTAIAAGQSHTLALTSDGKAYAWGSNEFGELGNSGPSGNQRPIAIDLSSIPSMGTVLAISAGSDYSLMVVSPSLLKTEVVVTLGALTQTYDGSIKTVTANTGVEGVSVNILYNGNPTAPVNAGTYGVVASVADPLYTGSASGTLVIEKASAVITLSGLSQTYNGSPRPATVAIAPPGVAVAVTYEGSASVPVLAGSYGVVASVTDPNYIGTASGTLVIGKAAGDVVLSNLSPTYDGAPKPITVATTPSGLGVTVTYDGAATAPTAAGTYAVVATIDDANYTGTASGSLAVGKATATVELGNLVFPYDGTAKMATVTTTPAGLVVTVTYDGATAAPKNSGTYAVVATIDEANYTGAATGSLVIGKESAIVTLGGLSAIYDGTAKTVSATTTPQGLSVSVTYDGSTTMPTNAGTYAVEATIDDANYGGSATGSLVIGKASATVTLGGLSATYDTSAKSASATTVPVGLTVGLTYDGSATAPTLAGTYAVVATISDTNYAGTASGSLVIGKASATVTLGGLTPVYDGASKMVSVTTEPSGLPVIIAYDGTASAPTNVGNYAAVATINDPNYSGSASCTLVIFKATATVTLSGLSQLYDGSAKVVSIITDPPGLGVEISYDGQSTQPINAGTYAVTVTVNDANYQGASSGSLVIGKGNQMLTFTPLANFKLDQQVPPLAATASSGLAPVFEVVSGPAAILGNALTLQGLGEVVVRASQSGDANWNPATPVQQAFRVFSGTFAQDFIWAKGFGGSGSDRAYGIATDSTGNAYVAADFTGALAFGGINLTASGSSSDLALLKVAADGNVLSATRFGGMNFDYTKAVVVDTSDNVILAGEFTTSTLMGGVTHTSAGSKDISLLKVNSAGTLQWSKRFGGTSSDSVYGLATDADGNILLTGDFSGSISFGGTTLTSNGQRDGFVAKLDPSGTPLWAMKVGGASNDTAYVVTVSPSGQILVGGSFSLTASFDTFFRTSDAGTDGFAMGFSPEGQVYWVTRFGGASNDSVRAITLDSTGAVCAAGSFAGTDAKFGLEILASEGADDVFIARLDAGDGSFLNVKQCGGAGQDAVLGLVADRFGSLYLSGSYSETANFDGESIMTPQGPDFFVAKLSVDHEFLWVMGGGGTFSETATSLAVNDAGHIFIAGLFSQSATLGSHDITAGGNVDLFITKINGPTPSFTLTPGPIAVDDGDSFFISAPAVGANPITYQWFKNNIALVGETDSTLHVAVASAADQGTYHCVATNFYGSTQLPSVEVTVLIPDRLFDLVAPGGTAENRVIEVPMYLESPGDVTGLAFELAYDNTLLRNATFVLGNRLNAGNSSVVVDATGVRVVGSAFPSSIPAGRHLIGTFRFTARSVPANASVTFAPTLSSISDLYGSPLDGYTKMGKGVTAIARRVIPGDANNNGRLDVSDAAELIRLYANPVQIRTWDHYLNDLNLDTILTEGDATRVLRVVADLDDVPDFPQAAPLFMRSMLMTAPSGSLLKTNSLRMAASTIAAPVSSGSGALQLGDSPPSAARMVLTRLTGANANKVLAQVYLDNVPAGQAGISFQVDYPASVLRVAGASSLIVPSGGLPVGVAPTWNVSPGNAYAAQTGSLTLAAAWGSSWTFANGQAVANIVFEVNPAVTGQVNFPLTLAATEVAPYNADGPSTPLAVPGHVVVFSRTYADWALATLGNAAAGSSLDPDGDGMSNALEYAASTNPNDPNSRLQTTAAAMTVNGYRLRWFAAYGVNYQVRWSADLTTWNNLTTAYTGTGAETEVTDPAVTAPGKFYRVEVVQP